jgi:hypothetical protein
MAENYVRQWLRLTGINDEANLKDRMTGFIQEMWEETARQVSSGRTSVDVGVAARRSLAEVLLEEIATDPAVYREARKPDQFGNSLIDRIRDQAGGYDEGDDTPEAAQQKRADALRVVLANRADDFLYANKTDPASYLKVVEHADPASVADARARTGTAQAAPYDIDGKLRDLDGEHEQGAVAAAAWAKRNGLTQPLPEPKSEPEETFPAGRYVLQERDNRAEAASDWSEDRLEKYFALRDAENNPPAEPRDPSVRRLTAGSPLDAAAFPDEYK